MTYTTTTILEQFNFTRTHIPVLVKEVLEVLDPKHGEFFIDGTINGAGHAEAIIRRLGPQGRFLGLDWDPEIAARAKERLARYEMERLIVTHANYKDIPSLLEEYAMGKADGLLIDLGFSEEHLKESGRGFSFLRDEPLDMRYNPEEGITAAEILNTWSERELADIFWNYGEEIMSRRLARKIVEARRKARIISTRDLTRIVLALKKSGTRLHPATKVFQALRITVNNELENLAVVLKSLPQILNHDGRAAFISFHSLEDRMVKHAFKELKKKDAVLITKKPIVPSEAEKRINPKSCSAKLRAIKFLIPNSSAS